MDLAVKDVRRHLGKFFSTIAGVGLLVAIVLIMNGIFQGNIADGVWLIENTRADLWVVERDRGGPFNESSRIPTDSYRSVAATPGVEKASPFISYAVQRELGGHERQFTIIGYDVFGGLGEPGRIVAGRPIRRAHYEMVADGKLGLSLGQTVRLGLHDYTVVGLTKGAVDSGGNPLAYLSLPDAQEVLYQLRLDRVLFVPAGDPPHKPSRPVSPAPHRVRMVELGTAGRDDFVLSRVDVDRPGPHYTVKTLQLLRQEWGAEASLYFIEGTDSLADILSWHRPERLIELAELAVVERPGVQLDLGELERHLPGLRERIHWVRMPSLEISSTDLRARVREGRPISYLLPAAVEAYVREQGLYRTAG